MIRLLIDKIRIALFMMPLLLVSYNSQAQQLFYSQSLNNLYNTLPEACRTEIYTTDTIVFCQEIVSGIIIPIVYCFDENSMLTHIGYRFMPGAGTEIENMDIIRFIERELLVLLTSKDVDKILATYKENGLTILLDNKQTVSSFYPNKKTFVDFLNNISEIKINYNGKRYEVILSDNHNENPLSFLFRPDNELILGMDKKEQDVFLAIQLSNHQNERNYNLSPDISCLSLLHDSIYIDKGNFYEIPQINNDIYYIKVDSTYNLAFDKSLIVETLTNALLTPIANDYLIQIHHKMYGGIKEYSVKSLDFHDYFFSNYDKYFGIETLSENGLTGTLILRNRYVESIHLAFVSIEIGELLNNGVVNMQLYSNIPQHNIESLFEEKYE